MDLTGGDTVALAVGTFCLAVITAVSIWTQNAAVRRGFDFERDRQVPLVAPMLSAGIAGSGSTPVGVATHWFLKFTNSGLGPACNPRFSSLYNGQTLTSTSDLLPPLAPGKSFTTGISINNDAGGKEFHFDQLVVRYEDIFGNLYSTEYLRFDAGRRDYVWRRPWIGKAFLVPKPQNDSADPPTWGHQSREYVDASTQRV